MKIRVYLSGAIVGNYRAQNIIKVLGDSGIPYSYNPSFFSRIDAGNKYLRRLINISILGLSIPFRFLKILFASHVIVLPMNSNLLSILEVFCGRVLRKKVVVDYYLSEYDTRVNDRKAISKGAIGAKWALLKDKIFLRFSTSTLFLNRAESEYYQSVAGVTLNPSKVKIVPLCIDYKKEMFESEERWQIKKNEFNVCWWGTYIPLHGLENLINAFSKVEFYEVKLYLFGNSDQKSQPYKKMVDDLGLSEKVVIINNYSFANGKLAPFLGKFCDLSIGNFGSSEKARTVLVNKLVDSLSLGLPCLTMETKAIRELLPENEGVILSEPTPDAIAEKIKSAFETREHLKAIGESGKRRYFDRFSPDAFKVSFLSMLEEGR